VDGRYDKRWIGKLIDIEVKLYRKHNFNYLKTNLLLGIGISFLLACTRACCILMVGMVVVMTMMVLVIIASECQLMEYFLQSEIACSLFHTDIVSVHCVIHMAVIQRPLLTHSLMELSPS
jgi:hypothetical protein